MRPSSFEAGAAKKAQGRVLDDGEAFPKGIWNAKRRMKLKTREYQWDNLRFLLIFMVVFGHLLEISASFAYKEILYQIIYSFHMPAFLFLSGMFAKSNRNKFFFGMVFPYIVLQTVYIGFVRAFIDPETKFQYSTPYWLLWYLFALIVYHALIPIYDTSVFREKVFLCVLSFVLALLAGFDSSIGYAWSASRIITFQLWFLLGFYFKCDAQLEIFWDKLYLWKKALVGAFLVFGCVICELALFRCNVKSNMLYGAVGYERLGYTWFMRLLSMCCAGFVICLLLVIAQSGLKVKIPVITVLGQNTLPIYAFHGLIVKFLQYQYPELITTPQRAVLASVVILLLLGNPWIGKATNFIFGNWYCRLQPSRRKQLAPRGYRC